MSHFAPAKHRRTPVEIRLPTLAANRRWVTVSVLLGILASVTIWFWLGQSSGTKPSVRSLTKAPVGAQPLIQTISARNYKQCSSALAGTKSATGQTITADSVKNFAYVEVIAVSADRRNVLLSVVCGFGTADSVTLTGAGWTEAGERQLEPVTG